MATGAHGRHGQALLVESLAMDAVHVVAQNVRLRNLARERDGGALLVALTAEPGDLHGGSGRTLSGRALDSVRAVAELARGRQLIAARDGPAVQAVRELLLLAGMAGAALHRLQLLGMGKLLDCSEIGMARPALQFGVRRGPQSGRVEGGRHSGFAPAGVAPGIVAVEAILGTGQRLGCLRRQRGRQQGRSRRDQRSRQPRFHARPLQIM